jgi:hypothetical protein
LPSSTDGSMTAESSEGKRSLLLELPKELRLMIYEDLLVHKGNLYFYPAYSLYHCDHTLYPQILRTCWLINTEATPLLFAKNKLVIDSALSMSKLCEMTVPQSSPSRQANPVHITNLSIHGYTRLETFLETIQSIATQLVYLQSLSIELDDVIMAYFAPLQSTFT